MSSEFEDQPIPLVDLKDDGTLEISEQALDFLSALKNQKISILTINGPKGSGKSFLANSFLDKMSGFNCNGNTKGLWMWGRPIELPNKSKLIIIDTQGLEANPKDQVTQKLFILSILISTCLIYNTKDELNDETINLFTQYAEVANKISIDEENKGNNNLEQTVFKVNKEATTEIAKQLRLRDIGGIIIIDYIDMHEEENKKEIIELLAQSLKKDRTKSQILGFAKLNILEMTRKNMCNNDDY